MTPSCVILDRDGVVNDLWCDPDLALIDSPRLPDQVRLTGTAASAIRRLNSAGIPVAIASNQPGVAKAKMRRHHLDSVTDRIVILLAAQGAHLDLIAYCLHHPDAVHEEFRGECDARKPAPGMLHHLTDILGADPAKAYFVGDTHRDLDAARRAGMKAVWIGEPRCDICPCRAFDCITYRDLGAFVDYLLTTEQD